MPPGTPDELKLTARNLAPPEGLGAGGEGDNRGQEGWKAALTQWT